VADKRQIRQGVKRLQRIKTWQLVILLVLAGFVTATFLRLNNVGMVERRSAVMSADREGSESILQDRLYDLQRFVSSHMNTDMGKGVYLESSYKRDVQSAYDKAASDSNPNGNIYQKAQEVCAPRFTHYSYAYLQCTMNELQKYPQGSDLVSSVSLPSSSEYLHVYASPLWSPDFAGWSFLLCVVIFIMIISRVTSVVILKLMLKHRYKSI
jgi:hypothetical protein